MHGVMGDGTPFFLHLVFQWNNKVIKWETGNRSGVRDLRTEEKVWINCQKSGKVSWLGESDRMDG